MLRPLSPAVVKAMLTDGEELALIDVREELVYSRNHLLWARSVPLSRIELRFARLVPRKSTRIVLIDDGDGLVARAAAILTNAGYDDVAYLEGGVAGWEKAGFVTFSGMHVPSKAFGEFVEHDSGTPSVSAEELDAMMRSGTNMKVLDSRPFDEFNRVSIPTGIDVPGAELVLRVRDIVPSPDTTIVVNCAGRTRSIIGAQSLIDAGVPNKVVALRNGTMGWHLAGFKCDNGKSARFPDVTENGLAFARAGAAAVAAKFGVARIDRPALARLQADTTRTTYVFDVRDPDEYERGHLPGAVSAPGGQLVQATDTYAGTLGARLVLCDDKEARALMTGAWLRRMGWQDVFVLAEAGNESGDLAPAVLGAPAVVAAIDVGAMPADATVIDLSRSPDYRRGHIPKMIALSAVMMFGGFAAIAWLARSEWFNRSFGFPGGELAPSFLLFGLLAGAVTFWFTPLGNLLSRKYEYEADAFAREAVGGPGAMVGALRKLAQKNLTNLTPHRWFSGFYYSHPTLVEREAALMKAG